MKTLTAVPMLALLVASALTASAGDVRRLGLVSDGQCVVGGTVDGPGLCGSSDRLSRDPRPTLPYYVDTEHFRIWYDTSGADSIYGWPDTTMLHECKLAAEKSWRGLVDTLGFRPPPPDSGDPDGGGGSDHYDIYICDLGWAGQTSRGYSTPDDPPYDMTSWCWVDNDFSEWSNLPPLESFRCTIAHEFAHGLQIAHTGLWPERSMWWGEAGAVWASDQVFDDIDFHLTETYLGPSFIEYALAHPYKALDLEEDALLYGRVLWCFYLSEAFGDTIIREIWQDMEDHADQQMEILCANHVLGNHGVEFDDALEDWCIWNWFTGERDDGNHYEEGGDLDWPEAVLQLVYSGYPVVGGSPPDSCRPDHLACNYVHFERGDAEDEVLHITYDGPSLASVTHAAHVAYLDNSLCGHYYGEIALSPWGRGEVHVEGFDEMNLVCLIVVNESFPNVVDNMNYTVDAELIPTGVVGTGRFAFSAPVPNPFTVDTCLACSVPAGVVEVDLSIYDLDGRRVTTLVGRADVAGEVTMHWDGRDADGRQLASGVYFARVAAGDETAFRKLVLLR
jgi:hypothetical protein